MASYAKRGNGWQARVSWVDAFGKRHFKNKQGFKTKALAKRWAVKNEDQLNKGRAIDKSISLIRYYQHWIHTYKEPHVSNVRMNRYRITGKVIQQYFKEVNVKEITRSEYQGFINWYGKNHAHHSVKDTNGIIRACVKSAIMDGYLYTDFTQGVVLTYDKSKTIKVDYLNVKEIKALLNKAIAYSSPHLYTSPYMIVTAIYTGMRLSEIQALTWNDIDWIHQIININKSWNAITHSFKPTKNESSNRTIKVNRELLTCLKKLQGRRTSNMVFINELGTIPTSNAVNKCLRSLLKSLNINRQNFHFHSLRHSHVALLLSQGIDIYAISKRLGHSNVSTTMDIYAYLIDEFKNQTDDQIIRVLDGLKCTESAHV